jgi:hypothetical protein
MVASASQLNFLDDKLEAPMEQDSGTTILKKRGVQTKQNQARSADAWTAWLALANQVHLLQTPNPTLIDRIDVKEARFLVQNEKFCFQQVSWDICDSNP